MLYVDKGRYPLGRMIMCHMLADTAEELESARCALGLPEGCTQYPGTWKEHLDVSQAKRALALRKLEAREINSRELVTILRQRRQLDNQGRRGTS